MVDSPAACIPGLSLRDRALVVELGADTEIVKHSVRLLEPIGLEHRLREPCYPLGRDRRVDVEGEGPDRRERDLAAAPADRRDADLTPGAAHGLSACLG